MLRALGKDLDFPKPKVRRRIDNRVIAGVCAGVADAYGMSVYTVRFLYVLALLFFRLPAVFAYLLQWLSFPER